jgi:diguanylate cyclase (GGDEF)-like protein/PAS domain S-box-containing protein
MSLDANKKLLFEHKEKEKIATELTITNKKLLFEHKEKEKIAAELVIANKKLLFEHKEKEKLAAELIIAREFRIAAIIFESQEGMLVTDANKNILRVNKAFTRISGYSAEEAIGQTLKLFNSDLEEKVFYKAMWHSINTTDVWEGEIWNRRKNGDTYLGHMTITAVRDTSKMISNYVATITDITLNKAALEKINNLAYFDQITQLPNRLLLVDRLNLALAESAHSNHNGALLFIDLNQLKIINNTHGYSVGNLLLKEVTARLTQIVRKADTIARLSGDEFVILLENLSQQNIEVTTEIQNIAKKIIFSLTQPYQLNMHKYRGTVSIGATVFSGNEFASEQLLKQADIAMHQSRRAGHNRLCFFNQTMQEAITARAKMEHELREAIEHNQFQLYYQIQVSSSGQALGAEALIRWQHPEDGYISPFNFIPLAEETGLILPIGEWVLNTACAQLKKWQQNPLTQNLVLAVNVSALQIHQENFVEQLKSILQKHEITPERLKLELTESMLVENVSGIITKINTLRKIGVLFSLDDFGTGYSSLQYLKKLPINQLKIDQSFVRDILTDTNDRAIVRTIITMSHNLGIKVIAEGVETAEQKQYLLSEGCMNYQGYLFSKPVPIDEFEALIFRLSGT